MDTGLTLNAIAPYAQQIQNKQLQSADASLRQQLQKIRTEAGTGANISENITYQIGADGIRYATGGNVVTSSQKPDNGIDRAAEPLAPLQAQTPITDAEDAVGKTSALSLRNASLADVLGGRITLSPLEFAQTFSEDFTDGLQRSKLQTIDAGVRSQESLHFRAAGGLASGVPQYGTQVGPDGELYATSGQVNIQASRSTDPASAARESATLAIAATAPGDASAQDIAVARSSIGRAAALYQQATQQTDAQPTINFSS